MTHPHHVKKVLKGNFAAAEAAKLCRVGFIPAYPITPQTTIIEELANIITAKELDATFVNMDSEHSVFAAAKGASIAGERVFTATSGQGLLYAHEVLHAIAHIRLPIVACNVGRPSFPWNIWCDQSDSVAQRDTGWIQYYCETSQEVLDTIIQSYKIAETLDIPVFVILDAFYLSHTSENVLVPDIKSVDEYLPPRQLKGNEVDVDNPKSFGGLVPTKFYDKFNKVFWDDVQKVDDLTNTVGEEFEKHFGRGYQSVEAINIHSGTKKVLVTLASITTTARDVVSKHADVGLLKIRLFKPFPRKSVLKALEKISKDCIIINIDRNFLGDYEGAMMQEMKRTMCGKNVRMFGIYAGLGGRDVPPETIEKIIQMDYDKAEEIGWIDLEN